MSITVDTTTQRYTSGPQPEPDIWLIHTTEGMSYPGYNGGGSAPHDTIRPLPGKGIAVRRHYPYGQFSKALANTSTPGQTNMRGVIQTELMGTCDPKHRDDPDWYYWPDADDAVLQALADYYRPILDLYKIPLRAPKFLAYPSSYGNKQGQRMSPTEFARFEGICGHQHAPENDHGDPGNFDIASLIKMLGGPSKFVPVQGTTKTTSVKYWVPSGVLNTKQVQKIVNVTVDGYYGDATKAAVKKLQKRLGVPADGLWGPATEKAYGVPKPAPVKPAPVRPSYPAFPLPKGWYYGPASGPKESVSGKYGYREGLRQWQAKMLKNGHTSLGRADGLYGPKTAAVVRTLQKQRKILVDGRIGKQTWDATWSRKG